MTSSDNVCHVKFYLSQLNLAPSARSIFKLFIRLALEFLTRIIAADPL